MLERGHNLAGVATAVLGVVLIALTWTGCGGGSSDTHSNASKTTAPSSASAAKKTTVPASFSACPEARHDYIFAQEVIATSREGIEAGEEIQAARKLLRTGEKQVAMSYEACGTERETSRLEGKICRNTPQELAEALEIEDTPANREYIGVYEATCGRKVPLP